MIKLLSLIIISLTLLSSSLCAPIKVHLVPHTHDDVGWLKTVDGYFDDQVHSILDTITTMLTKEPTRKFVYVEMAFFKKWWDLQTDEKKDSVRLLVKNKQFEIINAGWSMNDEACPYYEEIIDNMQTGIEWINNELGFTSYIGWHLDPFGHSSTNARIQAKLGFDIIVFSRMNEQDRAIRFKNKTLRTVWTPHNREKILAEPNTSNYCDPGWMRDETFGPNEVEAQADKFYNYLKTNSEYYEKKVLLQLLGCDFEYVNGPEIYGRHLRAVEYIWANPERYPDIEQKYSIASEYLEDLVASGETYTTKQDDYWAYGDGNNDYWSGYFTSRPLMKYLARYTGKLFQSIRQLLAFNVIRKTPEEREHFGKAMLNSTEEFVALQIGVTQHHDAVSGTAKQFVTDDYYKRLYQAMSKMTDIAFTALNLDIKALFVDTTKDHSTNGVSGFPEKLELCDLQDPYTTDCISKSMNANQSALIAVYNPSDNSSKVHKVPIADEKVTVYNSENKELKGEVFCINQSIGEQCYLFFFDTKMKIFETNYYLLRADNASTTKKIELSECDADNYNKCTLTTKGYGEDLIVRFQPSADSTLMFTQVKNPSQNFKQSVDYRNYISMVNNGPNSGAYVFRPNEDTYINPDSYSTFRKVLVGKGELVSLARFEGDYANCTIGFNHYESEKFNEGILMTIEPEIGDITIGDGKGREVVQLLTHSEIENNGVFYTDSNGLDMQKRRYGKQDTFDITPDKYDLIPSSYYPVNAAIYVEDDTIGRMTVLTDRTEGGTSRNNGQIETMMHRRTVLDKNGGDDNKGVGEALNEKGPDGAGLKIRPLYHVIIEAPTSASKAMANVRNFNIDYRPMVMYGLVKHTESFTGFNKNNSVGVDLGKNVSLPEGLKLFLDYKPNGDYYLMRLHNISERKMSLSWNQQEKAQEIGSGAKALEVEFVEMSLSDQETIEEMKARKIDWIVKHTIEKLDQEMNKRRMITPKFEVERILNEETNSAEILVIDEFDVRSYRLKIKSAQFLTKNGSNFGYW